MHDDGCVYDTTISTGGAVAVAHLQQLVEGVFCNYFGVQVPVPAQPVLQTCTRLAAALSGHGRLIDHSPCPAAATPVPRKICVLHVRPVLVLQVMLFSCVVLDIADVVLVSNRVEPETISAVHH
jgi:hypothetical protein